MNYYKFTLVITLSLVLIFGCSKKKEEAAEMEAELLGQADTTAVDTGVSMTAADSAAGLADETIVPEEEEFVPSAPPGAGYTVQVAGCEDRAYAEFLLDKYSQRGYEPYLTQANVGGQTYYRVRIGAFETLSEAKALKAQIADRYSVDAWVDYTQ